MAAVTRFCTLDFVARMLGEDRDLFEIIIVNDDNLPYGAIVTVHTGSDGAITALTDDSIIELKNMIAAALRPTRRGMSSSKNSSQTASWSSGSEAGQGGSNRLAVTHKCLLP